MRIVIAPFLLLTLAATAVPRAASGLQDTEVRVTLEEGTNMATALSTDGRMLANYLLARI